MPKRPSPTAATHTPPDTDATPPTVPISATRTPSPNLSAPGRDLPRCERDQLIDPATCELMPGHQHPADDVAELAESIGIVGQLHPGQVFEFPDGRRWIAAGRRRWLACTQRHFLYRADVWQCASEEIARGEDLARVIRLVENDQRTDPSAYDLAVQLRRIRNERALQSVDEIAAHVGMTASRVKLYLSVFQGSDRLLDAVEKHRMPVSVAVELTRCEKQFGEASARKYIRRAVAGELGARELKRIRERRRHGKRSAKRREVEREWRTLARRAEKLFAADPAAGARYSSALVDALERLREGK